MMKEIKQHPESIDAQEMFFADVDFSGLSWREGKKEFVLHGEYYDVIQIKTVSGGKRIKCVKDTAENELVAQYLQSGKGKPNPFQQLLKISWLKCFMEPNESMNTASIKPLVLCEKHHFSYQFSVSENTLNISSPPPNFL